MSVGFQWYEFVEFDGEGRELDRHILRKSSDSAARAQAGRMAKASGGLVDLARAGNVEWNDRYLTTASPSEFHSTGYRFERLDG